MKNMRKFFALLLAMVMTMAACFTVFAAGTPHSITIENTNTSISIDGKEYKAYKLFDSTQNADKTAYSYYMNVENQFYVNTGTKAVVEKYFTLTEIAGDASKVSVTPKDNFDARKFGDEMQPFLVAAAADKTAIASGEEAVFTLDEGEAGQGYYLITGTVAPKDQTDPAQEDVVSAVIVTNEDPDPVAKPKAGIPTLDKKVTKVEEGNTQIETAVLDDKGKAAVAKVGSTVSYELDSTVPDLTGYKDYTFKFGDAITAGLDYVKGSFRLEINGNEEQIAPAFADGDKSFTLTIPFDMLSRYTAGDAIKLTYQCTVNEKALTYDFDKNTAKITYSRSPYDDKTNETPDKDTYIINLNIDVDKVADSAEGKKLDGAQFKLYRMDGNSKLFYKWNTTDKKVEWAAEADADVFTTDREGKLDKQIQGLDQGEYYLLETKAPAGYNALSAPVKVVITATANGTGEKDSTKVEYTAEVDGNAATVKNGTVDLTEEQKEAQPVAVATIVNKPGQVLPSTGGIGTTLFYIIGSVLMIGAGVVLVSRKRMNIQ